MVLRTRALYALALIMNTATGVMVVAVPLLAIRFGASALELGLLSSFGALAYALTCPFAGRHSDRAVDGPSAPGASPRRRSILLACGLLLLVDLSIFLVTGLRDVFILVVCGCFCAAFFWPPLQAWLAEIKSRAPLNRRLARFNLSWSFGIMVGPMIGGFLFARDYRLPWLFGVATNSFILALLVAARGSAGCSGEREEDPGPGERGRDEKSFLAVARWANFVCWFALANVQAIYPKLAVARGFSPQLIGYLLFLVGVTQTAFFVILGLSPFWHYRYLPLIAVHGLAAVGMLMLFSFSSMVPLSLAFALLGLALALSYYSSIYYSLEGQEEKGKRTGIHELIVGSGFLLGPLAGGLCAQFITLRAPFLVCAVLLAGTALGEVILAIRRRNTALT